MRKTKASPQGVKVELPAQLDLTAAGPLAERLLAARGQSLVIDASKVERLGGQCLQVLLSAVATWKNEMNPIDIAKPSAGFEEGLRLLGMSVDSLCEKEILQ